MASLPSNPPFAFRTMIRDKKAGWALRRTNFNYFSWKSVVCLVVAISVIIIAFELLW